MNCPVCQLPMRKFIIDGEETWKCTNYKVHAQAVQDAIARKSGSAGGKKRAPFLRKGRKKK